MLWWQEQTPNKNWITGAWIICKFALGTNVGTQEASEQDLNKKYNLQVFIAAKTWSDNCLGDKVHSRPHPASQLAPEVPIIHSSVPNIHNFKCPFHFDLKMNLEYLK